MVTVHTSVLTPQDHTGVSVLTTHCMQSAVMEEPVSVSFTVT